MNRYKFTLICTLFATIAVAQVDEARMKRDIEVASTVLNSLLDKQGIMNWQGVNGTPNGRYIEGYGVILNMPNNHVLFGNMPFGEATFNNRNFVVRMDDEDDHEEIIMIDGKVVTDDNKEREKDRAAKGMDLAEREQYRVERAQVLAEREQELAIKAEELANRTIRFFRIDSLKAENDEKRLEKMKLFLLDYAHLISQLKPDEKVLVVDKNNATYGFDDIYRVESMKRNRLSAEITMKDAMAFQNGKISREEATKRIIVNKNDTPKKSYKDLELYKSIIDRIYSADLSETYYSNGPIGYEYIDDLGAIFYMNTVSSTMESGGKWRVPTQDKSELNQEKRDEIVKNLYPNFEAQLKENMVEYGRTISSLKDNERLMFNVKITKCEGCSIPKTLELSIGAKDLKDYNSGKINLQEATNKIKVIQGEMQ